VSSYDVESPDGTSALGLLHSTDTRTGVQMDVALDDQAVLEELADVLAYTLR
jgi:hypothetical protein